MDKYILEGKTPKLITDFLKFARWFETAERHVAQDVIGSVRISTVFMAYDHQWGDDGPPILFETMIFGGELDQEQWRYSTWEEAEQGHAAALALVKAKLN